MPKLPTSFSSKPPWDKFSLFVQFLVVFFIKLPSFLAISAQFLLERCIVQVSFNAQTRKDVRHRHSFNTGILIQSTHHHFQPNLKYGRKEIFIHLKTAGSKTGRSRQLRVPGEIIFNLIVFNREKKLRSGCF